MSDYIIKWQGTYAVSGLCRFFASDVQDFLVIMLAASIFGSVFGIFGGGRGAEFV